MDCKLQEPLVEAKIVLMGRKPTGSPGIRPDTKLFPVTVKNRFVIELRLSGSAVFKQIALDLLLIMLSTNGHYDWQIDSTVQRLKGAC